MSNPELDPLDGDDAEDSYKWMEQRCDALSQELMIEGCADTVLILVTVRDPRSRSTNCFSKAAGNWYANIGAAREFLEKDQARIHKYINEGESR